MEQTFDSITLLYKTLGSLSVKPAYLWNGLTTENKAVSMQSPLINLNYNLSDIGSLIGYGYWLDYNNPMIPVPLSMPIPARRSDCVSKVLLQYQMTSSCSIPQNMPARVITRITPGNLLLIITMLSAVFLRLQVIHS